MSNSFYNSTGAPASRASLSSAAIRAEFAAIMAAFDLFPTLSSNANEVLVVNSAGTAVVSIPVTGSLADTGSTQTFTNKTLTSPAINGGTITTPTLVTPTITNYTETTNAPAAGSSFTISLANGTAHKVTTNANTTIDLPAPVAGKSYSVGVFFGGAHTLAFTGGGTIRWTGGSQPTATSVNGKVDFYTFWSVDSTYTFAAAGCLNA